MKFDKYILKGSVSEEKFGLKVVTVVDNSMGSLLGTPCTVTIEDPGICVRGLSFPFLSPSFPFSLPIRSRPP